MTTSPAPVLLIVGGDPKDVATTASALDRRFGSDYRVLTADSAAAGLAELELLADRSEQVALVAADLHLPDDWTGSQLLERAAGLHRGIARVLLFDMDRPPHANSLHRAARAAAGERARADRLLDGEGLGQSRGVALPPGAGGPQRLVRWRTARATWCTASSASNGIRAATICVTA